MNQVISCADCDSWDISSQIWPRDQLHGEGHSNQAYEIFVPEKAEGGAVIAKIEADGIGEGVTYRFDSGNEANKLVSFYGIPS